MQPKKCSGCFSSEELSSGDIVPTSKVREKAIFVTDFLNLNGTVCATQENVPVEFPLRNEFCDKRRAPNFINNDVASSVLN